MVFIYFCKFRSIVLFFVDKLLTLYKYLQILLVSNCNILLFKQNKTKLFQVKICDRLNFDKKKQIVQ